MLLYVQNKRHLNELVYRERRTVLIAFISRARCRYCQYLEQIIANLSQRYYATLVAIVVDTDLSRELRYEFRCNYTPTFVIMRMGMIIDRFYTLSPEELEFRVENNIVYGGGFYDYYPDYYGNYGGYGLGLYPSGSNLGLGLGYGGYSGYGYPGAYSDYYGGGYPDLYYDNYCYGGLGYGGYGNFGYESIGYPGFGYGGLGSVYGNAYGGYYPSSLNLGGYYPSSLNLGGYYPSSLNLGGMCSYGSCMW